MAARISPTNPRPEINTRQELFCRLIAEGRSQYESYTEAGYKATTRGAADVEACKLLKAPKIIARVKEIQAENALAARISVASVTKMYVAIYDKAMANDDLGPATAAVTGVAKLHGLVIDRAADRGGDQKAVVRSERRRDDVGGGLVRAVRIEDRHRRPTTSDCRSPHPSPNRRDGPRPTKPG